MSATNEPRATVRLSEKEINWILAILDREAVRKQYLIPYHDGDRPVSSGVYVAYTNGPVNIRAEPVLLFYDAHGRQWFHRGSDMKYRDNVYCCVGPLPIVPSPINGEINDHDLCHPERS